MAVPIAEKWGSSQSWPATLSRSAGVKEPNLTFEVYSRDSDDDRDPRKDGWGPRSLEEELGRGCLKIDADCTPQQRGQSWKETLPKLRKSLSDGSLLRFGPPLMSPGGSVQGVTTYFEPTPSRGVLEVRCMDGRFVDHV